MLEPEQSCQCRHTACGTPCNSLTGTLTSLKLQRGIHANLQCIINLSAAGSVELSVVLCDDGYITQLNKEYRGKSAPTDVLSFPAADWDFLIADAPLALGDIVISLNTAEKQAADQGYGP